jgi:DNA-binding SARP family transcriptional activator
LLPSSKLRRVVPLDGGRIQLPSDAYVDVEAARDAVHRAGPQSLRTTSTLRGRRRRSRRPVGTVFLLGEDAEWIEDERRSLASLHLRALEAYAQASLGVGGTELAGAVRAGRDLVRLEPYRESGYRILMQGLAAEGNSAEALLVYDDLRRLLHNELGTAPSAATQELHRSLLG